MLEGIFAALLELSQDDGSPDRRERAALTAVAIRDVTRASPELADDLVAIVVSESQLARSVHVGDRRGYFGEACVAQIHPRNRLNPWWSLSALVGVDYASTFRCLHVAAVTLAYFREECGLEPERYHAGYKSGKCGRDPARAGLASRAAVRIDEAGYDPREPHLLEALQRAVEGAEDAPSAEPPVCMSEPKHRVSAPRGWVRHGSPPRDARRYAHRFLGEPVGAFHRGARFGYLVEFHCDARRGWHKGVSVFKRKR